MSSCIHALSISLERELPSSHAHGADQAHYGLFGDLADVVILGRVDRDTSPRSKSKDSGVGCGDGGSISVPFGWE